MASHESPVLLLASHDPVLLRTFGSLLQATGAHVEVVLSAEKALAFLGRGNQPSLFILDSRLPDMPTGQFLAAARANSTGPHLPIVLIADTVSQQWVDRLADGAIDDLILRAAEPAYWQVRIDLILRSRQMAIELESLRDTAIRNAQFDRLTGVYNRETMLSMLFRESDRAQRTNNAFCLVLLDIDDFGHWNSRLGVDACDDLLCQVASRTGALLRSYDLLGRPGMDEFLIALPACSPASAMVLGERLRVDVFAVPFRVAGEAIRLSACFGIANSRSRSPVVVLREAERALEWAKAAGPESIQCFGSQQEPAPSPVRFLSDSSGDDLLAW
ncbi:MAG TPA: diguanylate cyclase [Terracidiphilus sp.]|nr:diguanylate cyclase [Terracidiphilus sp.]